MLNSDTKRRLSQVEQRLDWLDQHGTRGVEGIRIQLTEQAHDIGTIEQRVTDVHAILDAMRSTRIGTFIAYALAIIPVYVLLFLSVTHASKG